MLDWMLHDHIDPLFEAIERRAIRDYLVPFQSAHMAVMASEFGVTVDALEGRLKTMIMQGHLDARIDLAHMVVVATVVDPRRSMFTKTMRDANVAERMLQVASLRLGLHQAGLRVVQQ
jgi:hypothetical protein